MIKNAIPSILFFTFGLFLVVYSTYSLGDFNQFGAAFMPTIAGAGIVIFSSIDFGVNIKQKLSKTKSNEAIYIAIISGLILFYVVASPYLGFILTSLIITAPLMACYAKCAKWQSFLLSSVLVVLVYLLFAKVLLVPLPQLIG